MCLRSLLPRHHPWRNATATVALAMSVAQAATGLAPAAGSSAAPARATAPSGPNYAGQLAAKLEPSRRVVYKKVGDTELHLQVFEPKGLQRGDRRTAFVTFHGGGWGAGSPRAMYPWAQHGAELGMVAISVQYRLYQPAGPTSVFDCVKDARSALRYVRAHAAELGIDPQKIVANGASAGGHLAAATALFTGVDDPADDPAVSPVPNALVLFSPVIDTSAEGYGNAKVGARWRDLSPAHQVRPGLPPTLTFHGTADTTTPFKGAQLFQQAMLAAGNRSELVAVEGAQHTYMFKDAGKYAETRAALDAFLARLGFLAAVPATGAAGGSAAADSSAPDAANPDPAAMAGRTFDLVVVEATPGGIAMAVRTAREGRQVLLVNHTPHLGGILSSGLGVWDTQFEGRRSPIYDEVRQAIFDHYRSTYGEDSRAYREALPGKSGHTNGKFEARVAERIFTQLVAREKNITVLRGYYPAAAERTGARLQAITFRELDGQGSVRVAASIFADCTYEGDVLPLARTGYRIGREARSEFNEPHAGAVFMRPSPTPPSPEVAALGQQHARLKLRNFPGFQAVLPESTGAGDGNVQAFNYRTMLSTEPANRQPVTKPAGYDSAAMQKLEWSSIVAPIPNQKLGWNRPQLVGPHTAYIEADWPARKKILDQFWAATIGLLYYMQHDPSVPAERRTEWLRYGLAKDEFADNGNRPYELYIREARRLTGRARFTEHDATLAPGLLRAPVHDDSIAVTEWYMDAHACTLDRVPGSLDEGKMMLHQETFPGQISYRTLLPQDLDNLLVPVCLSATHVAWGTVRLEPTWMNIGETAAYAALQALQHGQTPAAINSDELLRTLAEKRVIITFFNDLDVSGSDPWIPAAQYFGTKGFLADYDARPQAPLTQAVAEAWAKGLGQVQRGAINAAAMIREVTAAEEKAGPGISATNFAALLPARTAAMRSAAGVKGSTAEAGISRGAALVALWTALRDGSANP